MPPGYSGRRLGRVAACGASRRRETVLSGLAGKRPVAGSAAGDQSWGDGIEVPISSSCSTVSPPKPCGLAGAAEPSGEATLKGPAWPSGSLRPGPQESVGCGAGCESKTREAAAAGVE